MGLQSKPRAGKAERMSDLTESMHKSNNDEDDVLLDDVTPGF